MRAATNIGCRKTNVPMNEEILMRSKNSATCLGITQIIVEQSPGESTTYHRQHIRALSKIVIQSHVEGTNVPGACHVNDNREKGVDWKTRDIRTMNIRIPDFQSSVRSMHRDGSYRSR